MSGIEGNLWGRGTGRRHAWFRSIHDRQAFLTAHTVQSQASPDVEPSPELRERILEAARITPQEGSETAIPTAEIDDRVAIARLLADVAFQTET